MLLLGTIASKIVENARESSPRRSPKHVCYTKLLRENGPSSGRKSRKIANRYRKDRYGKLLRDLPRGVFLRGKKLYYRHTISLAAQHLLNRREIWRSLRTDSLLVALRRLPGVVARIEMEIEHARALAGLPVDALLIEPLSYDLTADHKSLSLAAPPATSVLRAASLYPSGEPRLALK